MAAVADVRAGLAEALGEIAGLRVVENLTGQVNPPVAVVGYPSVRYDSTLQRGADEFEFTVRVVVGTSSARAAFQSLDDYMTSTGSASIKAAVEDDATLGGAAQWARVSAAETALLEVGQVEYLVGVWTVEVMA